MLTRPGRAVRQHGAGRATGGQVKAHAWLRKCRAAELSAAAAAAGISHPSALLGKAATCCGAAGGPEGPGEAPASESAGESWSAGAASSSTGSCVEEVCSTASGRLDAARPGLITRAHDTCMQHKAFGEEAWPRSPAGQGHSLTRLPAKRQTAEEGRSGVPGGLSYPRLPYPQLRPSLGHQAGCTADRCRCCCCCCCCCCCRCCCCCYCCWSSPDPESQGCRSGCASSSESQSRRLLRPAPLALHRRTEAARQRVA